MRLITLCALAGILLFLAGCGDSNAFEFKSKAASSPSGDAIKIRYEMEKGEGVRMNTSMKGTMEMSGPVEMTQPIDMTMVITLECTDVKDDGDRVLEMRIEDMKMKMAGSGGAMPENMFDNFTGKMTIGPDGKIKSVDVAGADPTVQKQLNQLFENPGFQAIVPLPPEGMRVGEALDMAKIMPAEAIQKAMEGLVPGASMSPEIKGELVMMGTRDVDGEKAAEFAINMVMNLEGSISMRGKTVDMDMGMKYSGNQFNSLRTGLPLGTTEMKMQMRMDMEADGEEVSMDMDMTVTIDYTKL